MSKIKIKIDDPETRAIWETVKRAKAEVDAWPAWKRGEYEMPYKAYTGIGSRSTPPDILIKIEDIAERLNSAGWTLRSGASYGADSAFELKHTYCEIYLPWKGFNNHSSYFHEPRIAAYNIAEKVHPNWNALSEGSKKLHARNIHQVLGGVDLDNPSKFLICWTPNGKKVGGTRTAIVVAEMHNIPVINLALPMSEEHREILSKAIGDDEW